MHLINRFWLKLLDQYWAVCLPFSRSSSSGTSAALWSVASDCCPTTKVYECSDRAELSLPLISSEFRSVPNRYLQLSLWIHCWGTIFCLLRLQYVWTSHFRNTGRSLPWPRPILKNEQMNTKNVRDGKTQGTGKGGMSDARQWKWGTVIGACLCWTDLGTSLLLDGFRDFWGFFFGGWWAHRSFDS